MGVQVQTVVSPTQRDVKRGGREGNEAEKRRNEIPSQEDMEWFYKIQTAHDLPIINLSKTVASRVFGSHFHASFLYRTKKLVPLAVGSFFIGIILSSLAYVVEKYSSRILVVTSSVLVLPALVMSIMMLAYDMVVIIIKTYEYWYTMFGIINLGIVSCYLRPDIRAMDMILLFLGMQTILLIDANIRGRRASVISLVFVIPACTMMAILVYFDPRNDFKHFSITLKRFVVTDVDLFLNAFSIILIFLCLNLHRNRHTIVGKPKRIDLIACSVYTAPLRLVPLSESSLSSSSSTTSSKSMATSPKLLHGCTLNLIVPTTTTTRTTTTSTPSRMRKLEKHERKLQLQLLGVTNFIDIRNTLAYGMIFKNPLTKSECFVLYTIGLLAKMCLIWSLVFYSPPKKSELAAFSVFGLVRNDIISYMGLCCTFVFCLYTGLHFQRDLLRMAIRSFNFLFSCFTMTIVSLCACDIMQWDYRLFSVFGVWLWYHWVLCMDSLTPKIFKKFLLTRVYITFVLGLILCYFIWMLYAFFIADPTVYTVINNEMTSRQVANGKIVEMSVYGFAFGRIIALILWCIRLFIRELKRPIGGLTIIRGRVEYHAPFLKLEQEQSAIVFGDTNSSTK